MLSATYQMAPAEPRATATDYCDVQSTSLDAESMVSLSTGFDAFTGLTKCTYFLSTAADSGLAPAWKLVDSVETASTKFWDYDLVTAEYFTLDLAESSVATGIYNLPTGVAKVPDVINGAVSADDFNVAPGSMMPMMNGCGFEDVVYNMEMWGGYNDAALGHSCVEQMHSVKAYDHMLE